MANSIEIILTVKDFASGALTKATAGLTNLAKVALKAGVALTGLATVFSIKAFADFESAMTGVAKTVDATVQEMAVLEKQIRQLAQTIPATTTEIAGVAEAAGQLGIETENIIGFTRTMIDLGNATNLSANQAATALARLANITGLSQDQFDRLGATVVALGNNLATTEAEIVEMSLRLSGAGSTIGLAEDQILALAGALSSVGIRAEAGGSAISRTMIDMASAVNNGGEELKLFAEVAGVSIDQFKQSFEEDAAGAIVTFIEGLGKMDDAGKDVFGILEDLGLSEIRQRDALLRAAGAGDLFRRSLEIGSKAWKDNTALTEEAEKRYQTLTSQFKVTMNVIKDQAITIGSELAPAFETLLEGVREFAKGFTNILLNLPTILVAFVDLTKSLFINLFTDPVYFAGFLRGLGNMVKVGFDILVDFATRIPKLLGASLRVAITVIVGSVVTAIETVLKLGFEGIKSLLTGGDFNIADIIAESFTDLASNVGRELDPLLTELGDFGLEAGGKVVDGMKDTFSSLGDIPEVKEFGQLVKDTFDGIDESTIGFTEKFDDMGTSLIDSTIETTQSLKEIWDEHIASWLGGWDEGMAVFQELSQATWESFKVGVGDAIGAAIIFGEDLGQAMENLMKNIAKSVISALVQIGIQRLAQALIAKAIGAKEASTRLGVLSAETFAGAFASTVAIPIIGPALAPAVAATAQATMLSGSIAAGAAGSAVGIGLGQAHEGITNIPREGTFLLDQGERVLSADQNKDFSKFMENGGSGGGGNLTTIENFSLLPGGETIPDNLINATDEQWLEIAERALTALNILGGQGETTTLKFREENI